MKAKVKFDSAQLKTFLLHHVEKLVFGGFVVAFLLLCWSAFKLKPYPKTPDELKATADRVSQDVEKATPPDKFADLPGVPDFSNLGAVGPAAVDPHLYKIDPLSRPYEDRQELRKEPQLFVLEELMAFPNYGGIAINENGGVQRMASAGIGSGMGGTPEIAMGAGGMGGMSGMVPPTMPAGPPPGMDPDAMARGMMGPMQAPSTGGGMMPGMSSGMMPPGMAGGGRGRGRARPKKPVAKKEAQKPAGPRPKPQATEKIVLGQPPSGSEVEGRYWVCLVGAIPYRKEFLEYQNTFRDARGYDPKRDYPKYALPEIERAEVVGEKTGPWQSLDLVQAVEDFRKWGAEYPDVVDKQFVDPHLTQPLPPLIFANHDKNKVNHPRTQLVEKKPVAVQEAPKKKKVTSLTDTRDQPAARYARSPGMGGAMGGAYAGAAARMPEYRLFRFFDFAVEPGKTYRYRVKLAVMNPNADVPKRYLENYAFADGETRESDWSQPSGPITVIAGNRLLAGNVTTGRSEPTGSVLAKLFDAQEAIEVRKVFDVHRGSVLNQREMEIGIGDANLPSSPKTSAKVNFETNAVVLDMFGGEKLAGAKSKPSEAPPKVPGHLLVLDNDGTFKTLVQSSDAAMYETESEEAKNQAPPKEGERKAGAASETGGPPKGFFDFNDEPTPKKKGRR
ncbi:MAG TPA: hypothetical protein VG826_29980 [Pirellulales bacterium]|nr:hypothetical protein [Pirellulales bacterium]